MSNVCKSILLALIGLVWGIQCGAQSSLGIQSAELRFGAMQNENGQYQAESVLTVDVQITSNHGLQGELSFSNTDFGLIGRMGAHLYLVPKLDRKYGVFATLSDVDGRSMAWGTLGIEGMRAISANTTVSGRTGLGISDADGLDFIFAGIGMARDLSESTTLSAYADVSDFDESAFRALSYEMGLRIDYSPKRAPWGVYAEAIHGGLSGRDGSPSETRLGAGVKFTFGSSGGADPSTRSFRTVDPVAALVRRDLW